jgi:hypothetical protein
MVFLVVAELMRGFAFVKKRERTVCRSRTAKKKALSVQEKV